MTDKAVNLTHVMLREIRDIVNDVKSDTRVIRDDVQNLQRRMTSVEKNLAGMRGDIAETNHRLDSYGQRLGRIERRLELQVDEVFEAAESFKGPDE